MVWSFRSSSWLFLLFLANHFPACFDALSSVQKRRSTNREMTDSELRVRMILPRARTGGQTGSANCGGKKCWWSWWWPTMGNSVRLPGTAAAKWEWEPFELHFLSNSNKCIFYQKLPHWHFHWLLGLRLNVVDDVDGHGLCLFHSRFFGCQRFTFVVLLLQHFAQHSTNGTLQTNAQRMMSFGHFWKILEFNREEFIRWKWNERSEFAILKLAALSKR